MHRLALGFTAALLLATPQAFGASAPSLNTLFTAHDWINGRPSQAQLQGKVVLVDFYTFDCINCKHVEPNLRELYHGTSRSDLVVVSVHSPETPFEHDRANLIASTKDQGVVWPVAVDNDFTLWNAYGVSAWPTQLIFDRHGTLRQTVVGEGQDETVDAEIRTLIAER